MLIDTKRIGGVYEVAQTLECAKQQIASLRKRPEFPEPIVTLAATPIWDLDDVQEFKTTWTRRNREPKPLPEAFPA